jgi:DNA mismatch repair protein MutS2
VTDNTAQGDTSTSDGSLVELLRAAAEAADAEIRAFEDARSLDDAAPPASEVNNSSTCGAQPVAESEPLCAATPVAEVASEVPVEVPTQVESSEAASCEQHDASLCEAPTEKCTRAPAIVDSASEAELAHFAELIEFDRVRKLVQARCASELGASVVERMRLLTDADAINTCLHQTSELGALVQERPRLPLSRIFDAAGFVRLALEEHRPLSGEELLKIHSTIEAGQEWLEILGPEEMQGRYPRLHSVVRHIEPPLELASFILKVLDGRGEVRDDASQKLLEIRRRIDSLRGKIENKLVELTKRSDVQKVLQNPHPTLRGNRFVLAVKADQRRPVPGIIHDRSQTGSTVFIEPEAIVELGNQLQDASFDETGEVSRILWNLTQQANRAHPALEVLTRSLGWLDFTHAKLRMSQDYNLVFAETSERELELKDLRHLLLVDQLRERGRNEQPVASTVRLGSDFDMLILTGPNTGGKTVLLKAIGLAAFMHQCGLPIAAAKGSKLPVFTRLFADIGDEQSIQQNLSTFSAHLARMREVLAGSGPRSLILIDELGAGTDPQEGAALGRALLTRFLESGALALITTHLGSLKDFAFRHPRVENGAMSFDITTLSPTYELFMGQPGASNALAIAKRLGLPEDVLALAEEQLGQQDSSERSLLDAIQNVRLENERVRRRLEDEERESQRLLQVAREQRDEAVALKDVIQKEADSEMIARFLALTQAIKKALGEVQKNAGKETNARLEAMQAEVDELLYHTPFGIKRRRFFESLRKNDEVFVVALGKNGKVEKLNKSEGKLTVRIGILPIQTRIADVSWIETANSQAAARFEMAQTRDATVREELRVEIESQEAARRAAEPPRPGGHARGGQRFEASSERSGPGDSPRGSGRSRRGQGRQAGRSERGEGQEGAGRPGQAGHHRGAQGAGQGRSRGPGNPSRGGRV